MDVVNSMELPVEVGREEMVKDAAGKEWHSVVPQLVNCVCER